MRVSVRAVVLLGAVLLAGGPSAKAEATEEQPRTPHPEPRVVVNVLAVKGPHKPERVQHDARFGWKRFVRCYRASGAKERAVVTLELALSGEGSVTRARSIVFEPKDRKLASCLVEALPGLAMPKAPADSTADVEVQLSPGDRPQKKPQ
jgi:hypothetical protein